LAASSASVKGGDRGMRKKKEAKVAELKEMSNTN
jgi:hypothetical protein